MSTPSTQLDSRRALRAPTPESIPTAPKRHQGRWRTGVALLAAASIFAAACGGDDDDQSTATDDDTGTTGTEVECTSLEEAAKAEGSLTWYSAAPESTAQRVSDAFGDEYDIDVKMLRLVSTDLITRYSAEADSGGSPADMVILPADGYIPTAVEEGTMTDLADAGIPVIDDGTYPADMVQNGEVISQIYPYMIGYNTSLVDEDEVPTGWEDLLDERWKGQIMTADPASSDAYIRTFDRLMEEFGEEYLTGLRDQELQVAASGAPAVEALGAGEAAILAPVAGSIITGAIERGAPLAAIMPDFTTGAEMAVGLTSNANHPCTARLFINWLLSEDGNAILNDELGSASPYGGESMPANYVAPRPEAVEENKDLIIELLGTS